MRGRIRIFVTFGLSAVLFIIIGLYSWYNARQYKEDTRWVAHTYEVISEGQNILSYLTDLGVASRGYAQTGNENYIPQFEDAKTKIQKALVMARDLTKDNLVQQQLLDSIETLIQTKERYNYEWITARRDEGESKAKELILANKAQATNQQYRDALGRFINNEKIYLSERLNKAESQFSFVFITTLISIALAVVFILLAFYYFLNDYDRRIESERKVIESETRIKKFLDVLPLGVLISNQNGFAYYANSKSIEILGQGIVVGSKVNQFADLYHVNRAGTDKPYPPDELPLAKALKGETIIVDDLEVVNGEKRTPLRVNSTSVKDSHGKIEFAISVFEDISGIKKSEQELILAKQKAEESSVLKEAFLANMSHEIRTPMNAIIGFTDLLQKANLGSKDREYVDIIKSAGENLLNIINDILDISKIEARMMTFDSHPMSVHELFRSLRIMLMQKAETKKLILNFNCDPNVPEVLLGDANRLTQILINLVGNAIKFTAKGSVDVTAQLWGEKKDSCVLKFIVKDTGIGISADNLQKIFERFQQAESNTTHKYGGTGLGLSIAKQLVEMQGGVMGVKSIPDSGTEFSFTLPFRKTNKIKAAVNSTLIDSFNIADLGKYKILLAEDSPLNIKLVNSMFEQFNIPVDVVENGKLAVEKIKNSYYDLVLMDMEMPEMNGYEATSIIRNELQNPVPIIAMTAHAMAGEKEKCLEAGMNDYISKPINPKLLFEKMYANIIGSQKAGIRN